MSHGHNGGDEESFITNLADQNHRPALDESLQEVARFRHLASLFCCGACCGSHFYISFVGF
jgi:hypothetical protein